MAKANIILPSGAKVTLEGTPDEVQALLAPYANKERRGRRRTGKTRTSAVVGPKAHIRELMQDGFFKEKRSLKAVQDKLAENGHIYPQTSLSPRMIELTKEKLLRRVKEKGIWVYANW